MADARSTTEEALRLLGTPQLGTFLMPAEREVVLHAVSYACETEDWKRRALDAEAKLDRLRETLNGTPAPARKEDAPPPGAPPPNVQVAGGCTDEMCKCEHPRSAHSAGETYCIGDAKSPCWCLKFQPRKEPHEDLGGDRERVAANDEVRTAREDPEAHGEEQDREAGAGRLAGDDPLEGGPPTPGGVAKWGRVGTGAWHLWRGQGAGEAECGETTDGEIAFLGDTDGGPATEETCLDCAAIVGLALPDGHEPGVLTDDNATIVRGASTRTLCACGRFGLSSGNEVAYRDGDTSRHTAGKCGEAGPGDRRCFGFNKSAGVRCGSARVSVERDGLWFCKRHAKMKEAANV